MKWVLSEYMGGLFLVREDGAIKSIRSGKIRKPYINKKNGYSYISYCLKGKTYCKRVHRLIAMCFIPNHKGYSDVNHIDGNKQNNSVSNLEWCSRKQNIHHYYKNHYKFKNGNKYDPKRERAVLKNKGQVVMTNTQNGVSEKFNTARVISKKFNLYASVISLCCRGKRKEYGGFTFRYENEGNNK